MSDEYLQTIFDKEEKAKCRKQEVQTREKVFSILGKYRDEAAIALEEIGLLPEDVNDYVASVGAFGIGGCGSLPDEITSVLSGEENVLSKAPDMEDARERGWVAAEILALCRFAEYGCNPGHETDESILASLRKRTGGAWSMFLVGERLAEAMEALRDPVKRKEYIHQRNQSAGQTLAWYTRPLIDMCHALRKRHSKYTVEQMFHALPGWPAIHPIGKIKISEFGTLLIEAGEDISHPDKDIELSSFRKFCSKHSDKIGKRKGR